MGKGPRSGRRHEGGDDGWPGLDGRNALMLTSERFEALVPTAFEHIMSAGTDGGRRSLAACWALGVLAANDLDGAAEGRWSEHPSPAGLALVGAAGPPPVGVSSADLDATADAWFAQLDAAGANDRIRAFADTWDRLARHDNPHGHPLHLVFAIALADDALALEPLPDRLMPQHLLDADLDADDAYLPGASRRIPGARSERVKLSSDASDALRPGLEDLGRQAEELGMPADATLGEILQAAGQDISGDQVLLESADVIAQVSPAAAHAFVATDGLILTEENQHLVDPVDARRWVEAAGAQRGRIRPTRPAGVPRPR